MDVFAFVFPSQEAIQILVRGEVLTLCGNEAETMNKLVQDEFKNTAKFSNRLLRLEKSRINAARYTREGE
jgi:hypothetical protein